ncbi:MULTISPECIES: NAD(P)H-quinone oxidoreductase [Pseudomonas]|uniref:NAD(P)H-quinone oxidoreductase n=1 Tax=Pseudomonas quercus TaxID=2722792 RepID=A0ABX0YMD5_9PSED|nr:NAD(P)H-quinone oxidoreductase [Pseudomonas sp. LY10J]MBF7144893.1 NAD(P)H-quinone oxidoreductase [Pseudomonas sp. LY10J]NJP03444.1 NAD(P)H-quinone oxidoreductase [Pseudomonas quercus]
MKALQGVEGHVEWADYPAPACDAGQVRIRVAAAGLNRADLLQRAGHYPPPPGASEILGLECAGVISEVGAGVVSLAVGDRVCTLLAGGGMAEEVVVDARHVLPVPEGLTLIEAAGILEVYATVWLNLFQLAALQPGQKVLLHAGASGIGSAAIQLCKAFGNPTWVTVGSADRLAYCEQLGAQGGVLRGDGLAALKDLGPFDVILDPVGGNYAELNLQVAAQDARWVLIGTMGGRDAKLDMGLVLGKRVQLIGSTLRSRDDAFKAELLRELGQEVLPLFTEKRLNPQIAATFPIAEAEEAFAELATNQITGKVVLVVDETLV